MKNYLEGLENKLWLAGSILLAGLGLVILAESWKASLVLIFAGIIVNPFIYGELVKRLKLDEKLQVRVGLVWLLLVTSTVVFQSHQSQQLAEAKRIAEEETQRRIAEAAHRRAEENRIKLEQIANEFTANRDKIIAQMDNAIASRNLEEAKKLAERYSNISDMAFIGSVAKYKDLQSQVDRENQIKALLAQSKTLKVSDYASAVQIYSKLVELEPSNQSYVKTLARYEKIKLDAEEKARKEVAAQQAREARRKQVEAQFSGWDGSHRNFERLIKASMNDPDSYEHVETRFIDNGDYVRVITKFRGKNAFGGMVVDSAVADFTIAGDLIRVIEE
ncbi:hypothetical protein HBN74_01705 [Pseudomonas sp. WS 5019]|nr:hypothetical protein [Pseudomonas sp. WS 5019]NMY14274.1 hypothetical protein [Pseudomonas sp. WS 5019]